MAPERKSAKKGVAIGILVFAGVFVAGGLRELDTQRSGTPARAKILDCDTSRLYRTTTIRCRGIWRTGDLLRGGKVVTGPVEGAGEGDVGEELDVRLRGDTAHVTGLRLVYVSFGLAALILALGTWALRPRPAGDRHDASP